MNQDACAYRWCSLLYAPSDMIGIILTSARNFGGVARRN